jgi:hypothetical protein
MTTEALARPRMIWGAEAIAAFIGLDKPQTYYLLQRGKLPARKVGDKWVAEEGKLLAFLTATDAVALGRGADA